MHGSYIFFPRDSVAKVSENTLVVEQVEVAEAIDHNLLLLEALLETHLVILEAADLPLKVLDLA